MLDEVVLHCCRGGRQAQGRAWSPPLAYAQLGAMQPCETCECSYAFKHSF